MRHRQQLCLRALPLPKAVSTFAIALPIADYGLPKFAFWLPNVLCVASIISLRLASQHPLSTLKTRKDAIFFSSQYAAY